MNRKNSINAFAEDPSLSDDKSLNEAPDSLSEVEDPDTGNESLDAMQVDAEQEDMFSQSSISSELLALRDEIEATLFSASGEFSSMSDVPSTQGIVGVGIGMPDPDSIGLGIGSPGEPSLTLFTESILPEEVLMSNLAQITGVQSLSTNVPIQQIVVGIVDAYSHRARHRPAPGGVSVGHHKITAGTLGSRAIGLTSPWTNRHLILSNNHVLANSNDARVGDSIIQPGRADGGKHPQDQIAVLARWVPIHFNNNRANYVDAAIGWAWHERIRGEQYFLSGGKAAYYKIGTAPLAPNIGMIVGKSGRTTGLTRGRITAIGVAVNVNYGNGRVAHFRNQIAIKSLSNNDFSAGGDSGSLIWNWEGNKNNMRPVGLLFAGGGGTTFANPIGAVLKALDIRLLP